MNIIEKFIKKIRKYTYFYFKNLYLHNSSVAFFDSEEEILKSQRHLDESFENTKRMYKEELDKFFSNFEEKDLSITLEALEKEILECKEILKKKKKESCNDYEKEDYLLYYVYFILANHIESLFYRLKDKDKEKIYLEMCWCLSDESVQYEKDIYKKFSHKKIEK